jgi:hypothetical protein
VLPRVKDGDVLLWPSFESVGKFACTPRRGEAVQGAAWAVGRQRRAWAQAVYGGAAVGWAAQRGRATRANWESKAVAWRFRERRMDRRTQPDLGVQPSGP